jgi:hypothetical protein
MLMILDVTDDAIRNRGKDLAILRHFRKPQEIGSGLMCSSGDIHVEVLPQSMRNGVCRPVPHPPPPQHS